MVLLDCTKAEPNNRACWQTVNCRPPATENIRCAGLVKFVFLCYALPEWCLAVNSDLWRVFQYLNGHRDGSAHAIFTQANLTGLLQGPTFSGPSAFEFPVASFGMDSKNAPKIYMKLLLFFGVPKTSTPALSQGCRAFCGNFVGSVLPTFYKRCNNGSQRLRVQLVRGRDILTCCLYGYSREHSVMIATRVTANVGRAKIRTPWRQ